MKRTEKISAFLLALVLVVSLLSVGVLADDEADYELRVLTFEDADYKGGTNFAGGTNWTSLIDSPQYGGTLLYGSSGSGVTTEAEAYTWTDSNNTELSNILSCGYGTWCYWSGGHAVSNYCSSDIETYGGFEAQLTVYKAGVTGLATTGGGHNGSNNIAVHYGYSDNSGFGLGEDALPTLKFSDETARVIDHMYVTNTTYALNCYMNGNGLTAKISESDWVKLVATGYDASGAKTGTAEIYLCNGPDNIVTDWTKWDLSGLGKVVKVTFNVTGSSDNGYGFSQPAYFAYDDVAVRFEKESSGEPADDTVTVTSNGTACSVTKLDDGQDSTQTIHRAVAAYGESVTINVKDASFLMVTDSAGNYYNEAGTNPFTLTAAELDKLLLSDDDVKDLKLFTPASTSKVALVNVMDGMTAVTHYLYIELTREVTPATGVTLSETALTLHETESAELTATVAPENTTDTLTWSSSDEKIATVADGKVTAVAAGTATITASCGDVKAECTVTVEPSVAATAVVLNKTALSLYTGDTAVLTAAVQPDDTTDKTVTWTSSDEAVVTVKNGTVTAVAAGTATVKATCGSVSGECTVTVKDATEPALTDGVYQIGTADELVWFAKKVNSGTTDISCVLTADIDLSGINWTPIGGNKVFSGSIDGAGHTVKNLTIDYTVKGKESAYLGLIGRMKGTSDVHLSVKDLTVEGNINITGSANFYNGMVGGVVGRGEYTDLTNVTSRVNVTAASTVGGVDIGGLACVIVNGSVTNCGSEGNVVSGQGDCGGLLYELYAGTMDSCYNTGSVTGSGGYVGGLVGYAKQATMTNVYNTGAVSSKKTNFGGIIGVMEKSTLTNAYNSGAVTAAETGGSVGSVTGAADDSACALTNVYYLEGTASAGVGKGSVTAEVKTADELKALASTLGEGFASDKHSINGGYPILARQSDGSAEVLLGDVNGDGTVDNLDANMVYRYDNGVITLTDDQLAAADVNGDGSVNNLDANEIYRYDNGVITAFSAAS